MCLDRNPAMNLATFLTTWMEPEAEKLLKENFSKNFVEMNIYPQSKTIQDRCVSILAHLFHSPEDKQATGNYTVGSSEALMLGGLAMKKNWVNARKEKNLPHDKPNIVMSNAIQVAWKKFCAFFDVEPRYVNVKKDKFVMTAEEMIEKVDENTIGVVALLGSTYTGHFEDVKSFNDALEKLNKEKGWNVGIHVDAASGGFIAPFLYPDLEWDFRLPLVRSINVSGHKYGFVYPGCGWILYHDSSQLPDDIVFDLSYLGEDFKSYNINFSMPAGQMLCQYYNFLRLGKEGYSRILKQCRDNVIYLRKGFEEMGVFELLSDDHSVPLITMKLKSDKEFTVHDIQHKLMEYGWTIPAYQLCEDADDIHVLRMVIRETFSRDMSQALLKNMKDILKGFDKKEEKKTQKENRAGHGPC